MKILQPTPDLSPATDFIRAVKVRAVAGTYDEALALADKHYGWTRRTKAVVSDIGSDETRPDLAASDFFDEVFEHSAIGAMLPQAHRVNFYAPYMNVSQGPTANWVRANQPILVSKLVLANSSLESRKIAALGVFSDEALRGMGGLADAAARRHFHEALSTIMDEYFLDPTNAGLDDEYPASVLNGVTPITGTADPAADIANLIDDFAGNYRVARFVCDPTTATRLAVARDANGRFHFPDCGPAGGFVLGLPLHTTRDSFTDSNGGILALIDPSGIAIALEGASLTKSNEADIAMYDTLDSNSELERVNLFQANATAIKAVVRANWETVKDGAVSWINGAEW